MKVQIVSDLHVEFHQDQGSGFFQSLDPGGVDVLIVAGDLAIDLRGMLFESLVALGRRFKNVVYVPGNHEYYHSDRKKVRKVLDRVESAMSNVFPLDMNTVTIDGQRFIGHTLWFKDTVQARVGQKHISDFQMIGGDFGEWVYKENGKVRKWFMKSIHKDDIVVTHHLPSLKCSGQHWHRSVLQPYFVCPMDTTIGSKKPLVWVYGHTHDSHDLLIGDTRMICNPFGYAAQRENPKFNERLVLDTEEVRNERSARQV